jgi:hypothetical protein
MDGHEEPPPTGWGVGPEFREDLGPELEEPTRSQEMTSVGEANSFMIRRASFSEVPDAPEMIE